MIRKAAFAGRFYSGDKVSLEHELNKLIKTSDKPANVIAVVSPHAGYMYSGHVAGAVFGAINVPETVIIISPNHTGQGKPASVMTEGHWEIPTGNIAIDSALAGALVRNCDYLKSDTLAHLNEHSLEVQLPFLFARQPNLKIVPITVAHLKYEACYKIGVAIAGLVKKRNVLIVSSSDMTHYEPAEIVKIKDKHAIEKILSLDAKGLLDTCSREEITMCGVVPTSITLVAARELGAKGGKLIKYATSGDISRDNSSVVGYAGITIF